jgi:hypothetical protein
VPLILNDERIRSYSKKITRVCMTTLMYLNVILSFAFGIVLIPINLDMQKQVESSNFLVIAFTVMNLLGNVLVILYAILLSLSIVRIRRFFI